ncbi:MAG: peroxiredoxin [Rhodobiaceae bacterium]|nr:peroxiredoxin [Rhodobiaceae bacterium]MCC0041373.1 peroxiredoxin [Rhodobiaceae bacterium]
MTSMPAVGDKAPDFSMPTDAGRTVSLADFAGASLVLYFYPKDDTSGCTREAIDFTALVGDFRKAKTAVLGVSPDSVEKHAKFRDKHALQVELASDPEQNALNAYGVWVEKSMYGRKYMGVERATFLIDATGTIRGIWRKVKVAGHAETVLEAARAL